MAADTVSARSCAVSEAAEAYRSLFKRVIY